MTAQPPGGASASPNHLRFRSVSRRCARSCSKPAPERKKRSGTRGRSIEHGPGASFCWSTHQRFSRPAGRSPLPPMGRSVTERCRGDNLWLHLRADGGLAAVRGGVGRRARRVERLRGRDGARARPARDEHRRRPPRSQGDAAARRGRRERRPGGRRRGPLLQRQRRRPREARPGLRPGPGADRREAAARAAALARVRHAAAVRRATSPASRRPRRSSR